MNAPRTLIGSSLLCVGLVLFPPALRAQELEPRAYAASPVGFNILVVGDSFNTGDLAFDPTLPVEDARADINAAALGYVRTLGIAGRSASLGLVAPYVRGNVDGLYLGEYQAVHRSGFRDPWFRLTVNLHGAPAMTPREFAAYRQKTNVGASLVVVAPLGQYDPAKVINLGANRWSFKPEIGVSHAMGRWTLEAYAGAWLFTDNRDFQNGRVRAQEPIGSFQFHAIYTIRPRLWVAFDANYFTGGRTSIDGVDNFDLQRNSRVGVTLALPIDRRQSIKVTYSRGARTTIGADFKSIGLGYQVVWGGGG